MFSSISARQDGNFGLLSTRVIEIRNFGMLIFSRQTFFSTVMRRSFDGWRIYLDKVREYLSKFTLLKFCIF